MPVCFPAPRSGQPSTLNSNCTLKLDKEQVRWTDFPTRDAKCMDSFLSELTAGDADRLAHFDSRGRLPGPTRLSTFRSNRDRHDPRRCRLQLEPLEGRDTPGILTLTYAAATHSLTVVGNSADHQLNIDGANGSAGLTIRSTGDSILASDGQVLASPVSVTPPGR